MRNSGLVALGGMAAALLAGGIGPAQAESTVKQSPGSVCGSGYHVQRMHALPGAVVYQLFNGTYNCAVTIKTKSTGTPTRTSAGLQVKGSDWAYDTGNYRFHAGPVKQHGKGKCVRYFGYHGGKSYTSPWGNCG